MKWPVKLLKKSIFFTFAIFTFTSCQLGPSYQVTEVEIPSEWKGQNPSLDTPQVDHWWYVFHDETLNELQDCALANSPTLAIAMEKVIEARAVAGIHRSALFPNINFSPSYCNQESLVKWQPPPGFALQDSGLNQVIPGLNQVIPGLNQVKNVYRMRQITDSLPIDYKYQLDLFGKYRGELNSAIFNAEAECEAYHAAILTLTTDLASSFYQMRSLDELILLLEKTKKVRKDALEVNHARWEGGLTNYIDVSQASLEYTNADAELCNALKRRNIAENQIATLIGTPSSTFKLPHNPLIEAPPLVPASLPSIVLLNRPDIAEKERQIASQHALIGVALAAYFPEISLSGQQGLSSPDLRHLLSWQGHLSSFCITAIQNIFDAGRKDSNVQATAARVRQAVKAYENQVLIAFQEIDDALSNIEWESRQYESLKKSVDAAAKTAGLSTDRYKRGLVNYLEVVESERYLLQAEVSAINVLQLRYFSTIQLIKAIGGTWQAPQY